MIFIKHFFSLLNRTSIVLGYFPVVIFVIFNLIRTHNVSIVKKWYTFSHFCYKATSRTDNKKYFLKLRNPFSSMYNFVSGRNHPTTEEQIHTFENLPQEVSIFFPQVTQIKGFIAMEYLEDFWSPEIHLLQDDDREFIARDAIRMLNLLHGAGFVHGDIKLKNMLYKNKDTKKLFFVDIDYLEHSTPNRLVYEKLQEESLLKTLGFSAHKE
ncbi:hypothetical protein IPJ63_00765 [Candidatus Nomurabacteria bacterium]|nr:MAG: hypothetical protein IPJ63_00765 [Candidatus Nomurabacteria bacterium]